MDARDLIEWEQLFSCNKWREIVRDAEEAIRMREQAALHAANWDEIVFYKGEAQQLRTLVGLESAIKLTAAVSAEDD